MPEKVIRKSNSLRKGKAPSKESQWAATLRRKPWLRQIKVKRGRESDHG